MAVQSDTSRISYAGNNSTSTSYAVPFVFLENAHLKAIAKTSAGVESVVTLTNHTGAGNVNGGTVRTSVAIPATSTLTIYRDVPITQTTTYAEGGDFPAASHERALDKLTQISQQNARQIGSSIRFSEATQLNPVNPPVSATPHVLTTVNGGPPTWETVPSVSFPDSLNALTDATTVNAADELIIQQSGITKRATGAELAKGLNAINGTVNVKDFGAMGDGVADDTTAIQAAIDAAYLRGGGTIHFPTGKYIVSSSLIVPQRVTLVGESLGFANQYVTGSAAPKGSILFLANGANTDVVVFRLLLQNVGGTLTETTLGDSNVDIRHFGGMRGMTVWGNRSTNFNPAIKDINSSGAGIRIQGARYIRIEDCVTMYCAEDGIKVESRDYGVGPTSCNNLQFARVTSLSNGESGFDIAGGDSTFTDLSAGYNNGTGMTIVISGTVNGGIFWNNQSHGVAASNCTAVFNGIHSYDNAFNGFNIGSGIAAKLNACFARGNGIAADAGSTNRANFLVASGAIDWSLCGCTSSPLDASSVSVTEVGYNILNTTHSGVIDGCYDGGCTTPFIISSTSNLKVHGGITSQITHPPVAFTGNVTFSGNASNNVRRFNFDSWSTIVSITSNTLPVGATSLIALDCDTPVTINAITYTAGNGVPFVIIRNTDPDTVTIEHNASGIRCANAANVVLNQHEAAMFVHVTGAIWQQVGGAY
jgi:hypothetical protein